MIFLKLCLFAVLSDRRVQGLILESYNGVVVFVTPPHLFLNDQSDYFFFEVKSCGNVTITMFDESWANAAKVALSRTANGSIPYACYHSSCQETAGGFSTADYCSEHKTFWVNRSLKETTAKMYFGEGCTVGEDTLTNYPVTAMYSIYNDPPFSTMELKTTENATWKLGSSACQPVTTTEPATATTTSTTTSLIQCPSGNNGGSSTSMLLMTTILLVIVPASL